MLRHATLALLIAAAIAAVGLSRRRPDHCPFAVFLCVVASADVARTILGAFYPLVRPLGAPPFTGAARVAFHIDEAGFLLWPAGLAALAILLFARWRPWAIAPIWAVTVVYLSTHYPEVREETLRRVYLGAELAALAVAAASIVAWRWRREYPSTPQVCALLVCIVEAGTLFLGAWKWGFWQRWDLNQASYCVLYLTLTIHQVYIWRSLSRSR